MTDDSRQAGAMEMWCKEFVLPGTKKSELLAKAREIDAQLAAEQAASCQLREALEVAHKVACEVWNSETCTTENCQIATALTAAPGPCVHRQWAEVAEQRVREALTSEYEVNDEWVVPSHRVHSIRRALAGAGEGEADRGD